ncbi:MAG: C40 family peptidase [Deltaproteobacteria bacterium]|nr:C40 family peptidase [Deltaproteobacteria bacterium]
MTQGEHTRLNSVITVLLMLGIFGPLIFSCARPTTRITKNTSRIATTLQEEKGLDVNDVERRVREEYEKWEGTRHVLGGNDEGGIDCSAFVQAIYKSVFHINLPRTTKKQVNMGMPVNRSELQAGDLVFFKPPSAPRHVGIYLSGNEFVHASKSSGVTISEIDHMFWGKYYWTGRRILR